jgi:hypothetical protein
MSKGSILVLGSATALTLMGLLFPPPTTQAAGRITSTQESTSVQEETAEQSKPQRSIRRLPTYYSRVVTQEQREEIYEIQETYTKELEAIEMELKNKQKERDLAIEAVLKPEQLEEVKRLLAEAKKRRSKKAGTASTEDQDTQTDQ